MTEALVMDSGATPFVVPVPTRDRPFCSVATKSPWKASLTNPSLTEISVRSPPVFPSLLTERC